MRANTMQTIKETFNCLNVYKDINGRIIVSAIVTDDKTGFYWFESLTCYFCNSERNAKKAFIYHCERNGYTIKTD
jgi:hypothetical protein